jgi:chromosome segregation protein
VFYEVDDALYEADIDRFIKVLKDFFAWTQFIIVVHLKKTMTCAKTIYCITIQESGVSKQVSTRFEDVSDSGHSKPEPKAPAPAILSPVGNLVSIAKKMSSKIP